MTWMPNVAGSIALTQAILTRALAKIRSTSAWAALRVGSGTPALLWIATVTSAAASRPFMASPPAAECGNAPEPGETREIPYENRLEWRRHQTIRRAVGGG